MENRIIILLVLIVGGSFFSPGSPTARAAGELPAAVDLRPLFTPVKDQIYRGSCATFASLAAMEYLPGVPRLSEGYAYAMLKENDLSFDGAFLGGMKRFLESTPMLSEENAAGKIDYSSIGVFGFNDKVPSEIDIALKFNRTKGRQAQLMRQYAVFQASGISVYNASQVSTEWIRGRIAAGQPVVIDTAVTSSWESLGRNQVIYPSIGETIIGYHSVVIVGYTADGNFIFRNSWGLKWGDQGYGLVSPLYLSLHLRQVMTIGAVAFQPTQVDSSLPERWDIKAHGYQGALPGLWDATLTLTMKSHWLNGGGIAGVEYKVFGSKTLVFGFNEPLGALPIAPVQWITSGENAFMLQLKGLSERSLQVCVRIHYRRPGFPVLAGCRAIPDILTWTPFPIW